MFGAPALILVACSGVISVKSRYARLSLPLTLASFRASSRASSSSTPVVVIPSAVHRRRVDNSSGRPWKLPSTPSPMPKLGILHLPKTAHAWAVARLQFP